MSTWRTISCFRGRLRWNMGPGTMTDPDVREALRDVTDFELDVNIVDLGLVYGIVIDGGLVRVTLSMTSPHVRCASTFRHPLNRQSPILSQVLSASSSTSSRSRPG